MTLFLSFDCSDGLLMMVDSGGTQMPQASNGHRWIFTQGHQKLWEFQFEKIFLVLLSGELTFADLNATPVDTFREEFQDRHKSTQYLTLAEFVMDFGTDFQRKWNSTATLPREICGLTFWIGSRGESSNEIVRLKFVQDDASNQLELADSSRIVLTDKWRSRYQFPEDEGTLIRQLLDREFVQLETKFRKANWTDELNGTFSHFKQVAKSLPDRRLTLIEAERVGKAIMETVIAYYEAVQPEISATGHRHAGGTPLLAKISHSGGSNSFKP